MRILFLCHKTPYPSNDGGAIATLNMIMGFSNHNDNVTVLAMQTHKHPFSIVDMPKKILSNINWHQVFVNTKLNPIKALINLFFSNKPYNAIRFESDDYDNKLKKILSENTFDIIQLEGLYLYSYVKSIREFSDAKIAFRAHNVECDIWHRLAENEKSWYKRTYIKQLSRRVKQLELNLVDNVDLLIPITNRDANILRADKDIAVFVSNAGIAEDKFGCIAPKYKKTIFYIGALDWLPNQEALLWFLDNVWNVVENKFPEWTFVIAGRNASLLFENEIKKHPVKYIGEVADSTDFIDKHNIMIVPLLSGSGMRIKIIEGMARGKCILTSKVGVEGIPAENKKTIYIQNSANEFRQVLIELMKNTNLVDECGNNALSFVKDNFNNVVLIKELRNFYLNDIANNNGSL